MKGLNPWMEVGWMPPSVPCHMALSHMAEHNMLYQSE